MFHKHESLWKNGLPLEKQIAYATENNFHLLIEHNDFNPAKYPNEHSLIVDAKISDKMLIEMTNPKETTFMPDFIMFKKLDYFKRADPMHKLVWVLIMSFAIIGQNISYFIFEQFQKLNIHLIELNVHAEKGTQHAVTNALFRSNFYRLVKQVFNPKAKTGQFLGNKFLQVKSINTVTANIANTVTATATNTTNHTSDITHDNLHQHTLSTYLQQDKQAQQEIGFKWVNGVKVANNAIEHLHG